MTGALDVAEPASAHVCPFGGCDCVSANMSANVSANVSAYVLAPPPTKALSFWLSSEQPGAEGVADEEGVTDEEGVELNDPLKVPPHETRPRNSAPCPAATAHTRAHAQNARTRGHSAADLLPLTCCR